MLECTKLRFKHVRGFKVHESQGRSASPVAGRHMKIYSELSGNLKVAKRSYTVFKQRKLSTVQESVGPHLQDIVAPGSVDNVPDKVNLDDAPRQRSASVSMLTSPFLHAHIGWPGLSPTRVARASGGILTRNHPLRRPLWDVNLLRLQDRTWHLSLPRMLWHRIVLPRMCRITT